ncbi:hypothetical protein Ga0080574_TMP473 (plasmid) [Salipiger abyssi]|uniref:Uncharacterized protein n=1 Tax=Salipiger abyssi TaxID=1250539 RepID=A0A1P8UN56_9RHOB|nr:hypothetical protein Ga0080574_TMP473 [Salipiger abyssi]
MDRGFRALQDPRDLMDGDLCQIPAFDLRAFVDAQWLVHGSMAISFH